MTAGQNIKEATPSRQSQVSEQLQRMESNLKEAEDLQDQLEARLGSILRESTPELSGTQEDKKEQEKVGLANGLMSRNITLERLNRVYQGLLDRIEL